MEKEQAKFRILVFPYLAYSHVYPYFELSKKLSNRNFHIYFCSSAINLESIKKTLQESPEDSSIELVELHVPPSPQLPPDLHSTKNLPPDMTLTLVQAFQMSSSSFSVIFNNLKPDLVIYDFFQPWVPKLAASQGIPSVYFATSGAAPFSYFHHLYTHGSISTFPFQEIYLLDHEKVDLKAPVKLEIKDADQDFGFGVFKLSSEIVLIKGCKGFDGKYMDHLSVLCQKEIVPTGLLVHDSKENIEENSDILQWLSRKERFSTLFICFGSEHFLSKDQIHEISKGLELCNVNFIWVVKFSVSVEDKRVTLEEALPRGFLERVNGRGIVVEGWVPQAKILSNPNTGAFASHCGWSSVTESLYYSVPVIAMPHRYDQPINARLVVEAGVGVEVVKGQDGLFTGEEMSKAIGIVFAERSGEEMRIKARKLSEKIKEEEEQEVDEVAKKILRLCLKNK
ncbi:UDP-glucosyltransferase 29-like [Henckelia pumila]|uniref:UDP-glucosyltransferase 29-like n=1 Tax=Henckelia pumila TaxID=405737 RepID=UPI003C6E66A0